MEKTHSIAHIEIEPPEITEQFTARIIAGCACGAKLAVTITRSATGIVTPSVDLTCPDCKHNHSRILGPVSSLLDVVYEDVQRLASFN